MLCMVCTDQTKSTCELILNLGHVYYQSSTQYISKGFLPFLRHSLTSHSKELHIFMNAGIDLKTFCSDCDNC